MDPFPPVPTKRGDPGQRFGWCNDGHHEVCRAEYVDRLGQPRSCGCPCHEDKDKKRRKR